MATSADDVVHQSGEPCLLFFSALEGLDAVCTLDNEDVRVYWWYFGLDKVSVFFPRVVASVEDLEASYVNKKHTSTEDMAGVVRCKGHSRTRSDDLVSGDRDDGGQ